MLKKVLALAFAAAFVAACETAPETAGTATTAGTQAAPTTTAQPQRPAIAPGTAADFAVNVGDRVFFDLDKYNLKPEAQATLKKQAAWLKTYPNVTITVEGHADERGTREYNLALGERRANAVRDYLADLGIARNRIKTISYGKERPVALGHTEEAWAQNRRAVSVPQIPGA